MRLLATFVLALSLSGCGMSIVHKLDVQQGNLVAPETFAKLKTGMTRTEVRTLLGTPLLTDVFHANRWDYYFRSEKRGQLVEQNLMTSLIKTGGNLIGFFDRPLSAVFAAATLLIWGLSIGGMVRRRLAGARP